MRHFVPQMSPARKQQCLDEAHAAGRAGAERVPDTALFPDGHAISDTGIFKLVDALEAGRAERNKRHMP